MHFCGEAIQSKAIAIDQLGATASACENLVLFLNKAFRVTLYRGIGLVEAHARCILHAGLRCCTDQVGVEVGRGWRRKLHNIDLARIWILAARQPNRAQTAGITKLRFVLGYGAG